MNKRSRKFFNEFGAPISISARELQIKSHIHVEGPLWKEDLDGNYPIGDQRYPIHPGIMIEMEDRYGNLHTNHITRMEAEKLHEVLSAVLKLARPTEREYDPNVAPCDDAEFGMKP